MKKTLKFYYALTGMLMLGLAASCSSDDTEDNIGNISSADAADLVAEALSADTGGMKLLIDEFAVIAVDELPSSKSPLGASKALCGVEESQSNTYNEEFGDRTVSGNFGYTYTFNCDGILPTSLSGTATATINYSGPNFTSTATYGGFATVTNLIGTEPFAVNGELDYGSTRTLNDNEPTTFNMNWTLVGVQISKSEYDLVGGSGTITVTGLSIAGPYEFTATYTVSNENEIILTIGNTEFTIDLRTGIVLS